MTRTTREMSDAHEAFLATVIDGKIQPGSGNQFNGQMDVRNNPRVFFPIAVDGKSTFGKTVSVTIAMVEKAREQALDLVPAIGLRWYADETLRHVEDWIAIPASDFAELLAHARMTTGQ